MPLVECVPNFSEGKRQEIVDQIVETMEKAGKIILLDSRMDGDHNRAVISFVGEPDECVKAAFAGCQKAAQLIDMDQHKGEHNRFGATDVIPFIPLSGITMEECATLARDLAKKIGEELYIPTYCYGDAALKPEREVLQKFRTKSFQYEQLKDAIRTNPDYEPDFGPKELGKAGATNVGVRQILIAYNIDLDTTDITVAANIARSIRFSGGGMRYIQAGPVEMKERNCVQVSMNITDYKGSPIHRVFEIVKSEAARYGVGIKGTEVYGMVPVDALLDAAEHYLQLNTFDRKQIIEKRIYE